VAGSKPFASVWPWRTDSRQLASQLLERHVGSSGTTAEDSMKAIASLAALTTIAMLETAVAQVKTQTITRSFTIKQGATVPIGTYYQINKRSCQAGPIPKIVQTSNPTIGKLIIEEAKVEPSQKQCKGFLIPGYVVRFAAGDKAGEERITYDVIYQSKMLGSRKIEDTITIQ
jgi:hypothetical protein